MTWVRFDDQFPIHRKVAGLTDVLYRLHTEAILWCARNLTDGVIRADDLAIVRLAVRTKAAQAATLVQRGLWHPAADLCGGCKEALAEAGTPEPPDGWVIHDYLHFQPSRAKVGRERAAKADRQKRWLDKRSQRRPSRGSRDGPETPTTDASITLTPSPPRPEGSGAEPRGVRRPLASQGGGGRSDENPDWRTLPDLGTPDPARAERSRRGAAAARAALARPIAEEAS